jgi:hypothetical protein
VRASRPRFAPSYGISESADGLLTWEWAPDRLTASRNYWISTAKYDHRPEQPKMWAVIPTLAFAWRERDYPQSATRFTPD